MEHTIIHAIDEHLVAVRSLKKEITNILKIIDVLTNVIASDNQIFWVGNGGSAADSTHMAGELVSRLYQNRKPIRSIALTSNLSVITAVGNDFSYVHVFSRQVEALCRTGDVLIALSTSGKSPNILRAVQVAKEKGAKTIGITGAKVNSLSELVDFSIKIESEDTARIQEITLLIGHIICMFLEKYIESH